MSSNRQRPVLHGRRLAILPGVRLLAMHAACVLLWAPAAAQVQRGTIAGTVHDATGAVLPGVTLQLTSDVAAPRQTVTRPRGDYRFLDLDPGTYTLHAALDGFAAFTRPDIVVGVGSTVEIPIAMTLARVIAEVRIVAATPVLDARRQGHATNFDRVHLDDIPTARDPWALMQHVPGVSIGRPNVGGSESTNQAQFAARGDNGSNTMWSLDGVTITDMAATGASSTYYDFNVFEEVQFTTGSLDARQQTGGLAVNLVTRRGTNTLRAAGHGYFSNDTLQGENISPELKAAGLTGNRLRHLAEYGGDASGPIVADRLWFWGSAGRTDVGQLAINGFRDNSLINTAAARVDAQVNAATRLSLLYHRGEKLKDGRGAGRDRPLETTWDQRGPTAIYKAEVSRVFAPALFLALRFAYVDLAFALTPKSGLATQAYLDFARQMWHGGFSYSSSERSQYQTQIDGNWARGRHEIQFGAQHRRTSSQETAGWPGDGTIAVVNLEGSGFPTGVGLANLTRASAVSNSTETTSVYVGDVIAAGRWTVDLGLRFDWQRGRNRASRAPANRLAPDILPDLEYAGGRYRDWRDLSPRVGVAFRITDRTIARASYARFASQLGFTVVTFDNAAQGGLIQYRFRDDNADHLVQRSELLQPTGRASGVDPADPAQPFSPNQVDRDLSSPAAHVFVAGVERELRPHFSIGVSAGHGYTAGALWSPFIGLRGEDFVECAASCAITVPTESPVYRLAPGVALPAGNGRVLRNRAGYHQRYWNVDVVATRRLANRWMMRGHLTLQQQREYFDDAVRSIQDPTPLFDPTVAVASGFVNGGSAVNLQAFSDIAIHATWIYGLAGLYQLPWDVTLSGTLYGRQGYPILDTIAVNRPSPLALTPVLANARLDARRYPSVRMLDARVQKVLTFGRARLALTADVFNVLNTAVVLRQVREATATTFGAPEELVAPRLVRFGLRVQF